MAGLVILHKFRGVRSSGVQFYFWFLATVCEAILFRTAVRFYNSDYDVNNYSAGINLI